jgi:tetratricopeptide (TPR) repeat protein
MRRCLSLLLTLGVLLGITTILAAAQMSARDLWAEFERNTSLGTALQMRDPSVAELNEVQTLADLGFKQAQAWVSQQPASADANYALGSWLLYAFRTLDVEELSVDASGSAVSKTVTRVLQGLSDDPTAGLEALKRAAELAPENTTYQLDYAAALADYNRPEEAESLLKAVWAAEPAPTVPLRVRTALLLAGLLENQGDLLGARDWYYTAIALFPDLSSVVERLRMLDALQIPPPPPPVFEEESETTEIEGMPEQPEAPDETVSEESAGEEELAQPEEEESS